MRKAFLLTCLFFCLAFLPHPFYLSVCDLKFNAEEGRFQVSIKAFTNDLEDALKRLGHPGADLIHPKNKKEAQLWLENYLAERFSMEQGGKKLSLKFLGFENEEESTWLFMESQACEGRGKLTVENKILYDFLKEQINIIHLEMGGKEQSFKLVNPVNTAVFDLL